jgi:hypothetical protein
VFTVWGGGEEADRGGVKWGDFAWVFYFYFFLSLLLLLFCSFLCLALVSGDLCLGWAADSCTCPVPVWVWCGVAMTLSPLSQGGWDHGVWVWPLTFFVFYNFLFLKKNC